DVVAEGRQALVRWLIRGRVGPIVVQEMRESQITHPESRKAAQQSQVVIDHVPALHAHQRGDLALASGTTDVCSRRREDEILWVRADGLADLVDEEERALDGGRARHGARDPDGEELSIKPSLAHPGSVDVSIVVTCAEIEARVEQQSLRRVRVPVDDKGIHMDAGSL